LSYKGATRLYGEPDEEYDLDNPDDLNKLGLASDRPHADAYCHFKNCKWVVEERKGVGHVMVALTQLESTVRQLLDNKRVVTDTVIIMEKLHYSERNRFLVDPITHQLRSKDTGDNIRIQNLQEPVKVYFKRDLSRIIAELREFKWD